MGRIHADAEVDSSDAHIFRCSHQAMATTFGMAIAQEEDDYAESVCRECFREVDRLEDELSSYVPHSDISHLNRLEKGETVKIGPWAFECLTIARRLYYETYGAFDVTMASAGPAGSGTKGAEQEGSKLRFPVDLDEEDHSVGPTMSGVQVDLGGIGKGYALDRLDGILKMWSVDKALFHSGGSTVRTRGKPGGKMDEWVVMLRHPDTDDFIGQVPIGERALSGSGADLEGPHIIDPRTGEYSVPRRGAWALSPTAAEADALSTAFTIMSRKEIETFCAGHEDVSALLLDEDGRIESVGRECGFETVENSQP